MRLIGVNGWSSGRVWWPCCAQKCAWLLVEVELEVMVWERARGGERGGGAGGLELSSNLRTIDNSNRPWHNQCNLVWFGLVVKKFVGGGAGWGGARVSSCVISRASCGEKDCGDDFTVYFCFLGVRRATSAWASELRVSALPTTTACLPPAVENHVAVERRGDGDLAGVEEV